ncbi:MAG: TDP-N-acetylfucosamine:lipid II N-acetylfucosaminyltransferase [Muribaculaceae bacterium]|nr:TDP-N-acetylfucosamine:lipid II N-acetylfucosaminyltransferase [Muribaculaceae bacterium]
MGETVKKNLHLLCDEKITSGIIDNFETVLPGLNDYIYFLNSDTTPLFARQSENCYIYREDEKKPELNYAGYSKIIIHSLSFNKVKFCLNTLPPNIPIYWIMWGGDLYNTFLELRGYKIYHKFFGRRSLRSRIKRFIQRLGFLSNHTRSYLSIFEKRDVTMVCAKAEYQLLRKYYPHQTRALKNNPNFFYYPVEKVLGPFVDAEAKGNTILVGNSNSLTNNHFYTFEFLKKVNLEDRKLLVPLNYGGTEISKNEVIKEGKRLFGERFQPLTDFLPLEEYNKRMLEAEYAVYGNWRQEAMGNIVIALYLGSKVFLSKRNPLLNFFGSVGIKIFILEEVTEDSFQVPLSKDERENNRRLIQQNFSWERMQDNIKSLFG